MTSIVIPAHDEAAVIGRVLRSIGEAQRPIDVVVACNGCTDDTAAIARDHGARVVEVAEASKIAALNAGDLAATGFPRFYVDADIVLSGRAVDDVIAALADPGVLCAAPPLRVDTTGRPRMIRAYFAVWQRLPYLHDSHVGSGVYAMSAAGRARFTSFPPVIADDLLGRNLFTRSERTTVQTEPFVIEAPWTLSALVRRRVRIEAGNIELAGAPGVPPLPGASERTDSLLAVVRREPRLAPAALWYGVVTLAAKVAGRWRVRRTGRTGPAGWNRDATTRPMPSG